MKYIKTFEQYAVVAGPDVNEGIAEIANKLGSYTIDLNIDDAKVAQMATESKSEMSYAGGKIATAPKPRWGIINEYRKIFTDGGVPANLVDKAVLLYVIGKKHPILRTYNVSFSNPPTFDQEFKGTGSILTYDKDKNALNVRSANVSAGKKPA